METMKRHLIRSWLRISVILLVIAEVTAFAPASKLQHWASTKTTTQRRLFFTNLIPAPLRKDSKGQDQPVNKINIGNAKNGIIASGERIPFVIERMGDRPGDQIFREIAEMCISVFFNSGKTGRAIP